MTDPSIDEGDGVSVQRQVNVVRESMFGLSLTSNKWCLFSNVEDRKDEEGQTIRPQGNCVL